MFFGKGKARRNPNEYKIILKRNKLLGEWAGAALRFDGDDLKAFVEEVIQEDFMEPGDEDVVRFLTRRFKRHGVALSESDIRKQIAVCYDEAARDQAQPTGT